MSKDVVDMGAPVASMTSRSKPSATPTGGRHMRQGSQKILVQRIALAIDMLLFRHLGFKACALFGADR